MTMANWHALYVMTHCFLWADVLRLLLIHTAASAAKSLQSCPTLCDPIDGSPPGFPVPGILQARTLEWAAFPSPMHESEKWKWSRSVVSGSLWPHGLQPTRLLRSWDFPGERTGVGAIAFSLIHTQSVSSVSQSCPTLATPWIAARQASLSITNSRSLLKLVSIESVMPFTLLRLLLLLRGFSGVGLCATL